MNVHLLQPRIRELLFAFLLSIAAGVPVSAQSGAYKNLITSKNAAVNDTIAGVNLAVSKVNPLAQHGDVYITILQSGGSGNPYIYKISYVPDPGFTGVDTFTLQLNYLGTYPYLIYKAYRVSVYPSLVTGRPDAAVTMDAARPDDAPAPPRDAPAPPPRDAGFDAAPDADLLIAEPIGCGCRANPHNARGVLAWALLSLLALRRRRTLQR